MLLFIEAGGLFGETLSDGVFPDKGPLRGLGRGKRNGPYREGIKVFNIRDTEL